MVIVSINGSWWISFGLIMFFYMFVGEDYDVCLEVRGWDLLGFNDEKWDYVVVLDGLGGKL